MFNFENIFGTKEFSMHACFLQSCINFGPEVPLDLFLVFCELLFNLNCSLYLFYLQKNTFLKIDNT